MSKAYQKSGVNIDVGNSFIDRIKPFVSQTRRPGVLRDIGGYGGFFQPNLSEIKEPVLVSSTDGVGTKLKFALELKQFQSIGQDLVAMCTNDIICSGAEPLFFLDYLATGHLEPDIHVPLVQGIAEACTKIRCALIGGETAEMPGCYSGVEFDLAGFAVGIVDRSRIIDGSAVRVGDNIIGIASSGFHSNGYSLVRHIVQEQKLDLTQPLPGETHALGEVLLTPTKLYAPLILSLLKEFRIAALAHITGGGFWDNIPRVLPKGVIAAIKKDAWPRPTFMNAFQKYGTIDDEEMLRVFNCGIGMVMVAPEKEAHEICCRVEGYGEKAYILGTVEPNTSPESVVHIR